MSKFPGAESDKVIRELDPACGFRKEGDTEKRPMIPLSWVNRLLPIFKTTDFSNSCSNVTNAARFMMQMAQEGRISSTGRLKLVRAVIAFLHEKPPDGKKELYHYSNAVFGMMHMMCYLGPERRIAFPAVIRAYEIGFGDEMTKHALLSMIEEDQEVIEALTKIATQEEDRLRELAEGRKKKKRGTS